MKETREHTEEDDSCVISRKAALCTEVIVGTSVHILKERLDKCKYGDRTIQS